MAAAAEVKAAISLGKATATTTISLQNLLGLDPPSQDAIATKKTTSASRTEGNGKPTTRKAPAKGPVRVHEEVSKPLKPKEKFVLATDIVNITLRLLTDISKSRDTCNRRSAASRQSKPSLGSERALQPRSGNTTPVRSSRDKSSVSPSVAGADLTSRPPNISATAECGRVAFALLRSVQPEAIGVKEQPRWQLETGMLAFAGRLIALDLHAMATKELRIVKQRLERSVCAIPSDKAANDRPRETLASLLCLSEGVLGSVDVLPLAINYQQLVLKIITISAKPSVIEEASVHLSMECPTSPVNLIKRQAKATGDKTKASKQLEVLSQTVLSLCPSVSAKHDTEATNNTMAPAPVIVFKLQVLALQIRTEWWNMAGHRADVDKELAGPFLRCLSALLRRVNMGSRDEEAYRIANASFDRLQLAKLDINEVTRLEIQRDMAALVESCGQQREALHWRGLSIEVCKTLEPHHARHVASMASYITCALSSPSTEPEKAGLEARLGEVAKRLAEQLTGHAADYETLLFELVQLTSCLADIASTLDPAACCDDTLKRSAVFAQRYARSYPSKNAAQAQALLVAVLRSRDVARDVEQWVSHDAALIFIQCGTLRSIANAAKSQPLSAAWLTTRDTLAFGRALDAFVQQAVKSISDPAHGSIFDDETLPAGERGVMLEWQLRKAVELAERSKYQAALKNLIPEILRKLCKVYDSAQYPLRRARVASLVLRLRESYPSLLPPHSMKVWHDPIDLSEGSLGQDEGLKAYLDGVRANLTISRAFYDGRPAVSELQPSLSVWQRIIEAADSIEALSSQVDNVRALKVQLRSVAAYLQVLGDQNARKSTLQMLLRLGIVTSDCSEQCTVSSDLAQLYLDIGSSEHAGHVLHSARKHATREDVTGLARLELELTYAEYLLAIDDLHQAQHILVSVKKICDEVPPKSIESHQRRSYGLLHVRGWYLESRYHFANGAAHDSLLSAKRAARLLNSIWASLEQSGSAMRPEIGGGLANSSDPDVHQLTTGVSKLQLMPKEPPSKTKDNNVRGAAFWTILPLFCQVLTHLGDVHTHHGVFQEADYYSKHVLDVAERAGFVALLSKAIISRAWLLIRAGKLEDAELCLAKVSESELPEHSIIEVQRWRAKAALRAKEGSLQEAFDLLDSAIKTVHNVTAMSDVSVCAHPSIVPNKLSNAPVSLDSQSKRSGIRNVAAPKPSVRPAKGPQRKKSEDPHKTAARKNIKSGKSRADAQPAGPSSTGPQLLRKLKEGIDFEKASVALRLGRHIDSLDVAVDHLPSTTRGQVQYGRIRFQTLMQQATTAIQSDITFNMLPESTISFPAIIRTDKDQSCNGEAALALLPSSPPYTAKTALVQSRGAAKKRQASEMVTNTLLAARECLASDYSARLRVDSTAETYIDCAMLSSVTMLLSAATLSDSRVRLHPTREALRIERPRICASQRERTATLLEESRAAQSDPFAWSCLIETTASPPITATEFQYQYIDILPKAWTAVSISLNEDCSELYATRYRADQSPLILRLPFSRHKQDTEDEEAFDYHRGKAELQEIIQTSNYTCHGSINSQAKGAKSTWWSEREALDRRLQELLMNMENIWFGGFKGIFSLQPRHIELLARFRRSLDEILGRYLPSRRVLKREDKLLALDNKVLELFIGLGSDQDGVVDLDEPLADLLYFIVDMLQFSGEHNAYDEIDFDGMAVDVLDALRSYHEAVPDIEDAQSHLILVLDKRLQAFPWESMPCLEAASVSRVGSMLTLRERLLIMHNKQRSTGASGGYYSISRKSGTYILNPSGDLNGTQTMLSGPLAKLAEAEGSAWAGMVHEAPSEEQFTTALTDSAVMLYFGHGAGTQYVRPRTIRRLARCSEVVWLMGCSSGAVTEYDELEPFAVPLAYMMAGQNQRSETVRGPNDGRGDAKKEQTDNFLDSRCMAVVATLWDVTDKDIDRFSLAVGEGWGLWSPSADSKPPVKTPKKRGRLLAPATPQQAPKTPKTPRVRNTPAVSKTPSRSRSRPRHDDWLRSSLSRAVAQSRDACYLRYLNGAAPVVYGVPVYLSV